jgi:hypothetical protein
MFVPWRVGLVMKAWIIAVVGTAAAPARDSAAGPAVLPLWDVIRLITISFVKGLAVTTATGQS